MSTHKTCSKCFETKELLCFSKQEKGKYGVTSICKPCVSKKGIEWARNNRERRKIVASAWAQKNSEHLREYKKKWFEKNAEKEKNRLREWTQNNKARVTEKVATRRAKKLMATPAWADKQLISLVYRHAKYCRTTTGMAVEVDHIVPLVSDVVCGLHVHNNLIVLTRFANRSKGNGWDLSRTFYP